jgi:hypothetical protein
MDDKKIKGPFDGKKQISQEKEEELLGEQEAGSDAAGGAEKNKILERHMREHPEGDPAVRRKNPSRDEIGRTYRRLEKKKTG